jgi:carboxyl-terminal processing protease
MMRKVSLVAAGMVVGAGLATVATQSRLFSSTSAVAASAETYRALSLFGDIFEKVRTDYVEKPDERKLIEAAVNGMLASLDPHSGYLDPKSFRDMDIDMRGRFGGLGIEVTMEEGVLKVVTPIDDTPAARAGIMTNDLIREINGEAVQGLTLTQAVEKMRGPINTEVKLRIERPGRKDLMEFTLTRSDIVVPAVRARMEGDDVSYIRISTFSEQTYDGLKRAIEQAHATAGDRLRGVIVDLRNNRGGRLDQAVLVSNAFLERGEIVSTRGRNSEETQRYTARPGDLTKGKPVVVLINGGSASAAEIVAGALQDHKRGTVMGTRSFGKGSVQTIIPLGANGALRLTTARYYTPSGRSIQAKGIDPDIVVLQDIPEELKGKDETKGEAGLKGHLSSGAAPEAERSGSSSYIPPDRTKDVQLNAALDLLRGVKRDAAAPGTAPSAEQPATQKN